MSFFTLLRAIVEKRMSPRTQPPQRTKAPLRLSQDSAVEINIVPMVLAEDAGSLFKSVPYSHNIAAVAHYYLGGLDFTRCYLSQGDGAYLHFASQANEILEARLYQPYAEIIPATAEEWAFWLADVDGYIGYTVMQSKDEDGPVQYQRSWSAGNTRIAPIQATEWIVDRDGAATTVQHQMMHYSRALKPDLAEHLLVSAVEAQGGMSVNFWLGIDVAVNELTVYAAVDAPH